MLQRILAAALALFVVAAHAPSFAESLPLSPYVEGSGLVAADIGIGGRTAHVLFDSGAGVTAITPEFARQTGCTPFGSFTGIRMRGDRIDLQKCGEWEVRAGRSIVRHDIAVIDLAPLLGEGAPPIDGILGLDVLDGRLVTLSLADRRIRIGERPGGGWREGVVRFQREAGGAGLTAFVRVESPQGPLWMLLDSGSVGAFVYLSPGALQQLGHVGEGPISLRVSGAGEHEMEMHRIDNLIYDGVLGERFMRMFDIAIDFRRSRIWWRPHPEG